MVDKAGTEPAAKRCRDRVDTDVEITSTEVPFSIFVFLTHTTNREFLTMVTIHFEEFVNVSIPF